MKKSLKMAVLLSATILVASPVIAPSIANYKAQTSLAATHSDSDMEKAIDKFNNKLTSIYGITSTKWNNSADLTNIFYENADHTINTNVDYSRFQANSGQSNVSHSILSDSDSHVQLQLTLEKLDGTEVTKWSDLLAINNEKIGYKIVVNGYTYGTTNKPYNPTEKTLVYSKYSKSVTDNNLTSANVKYSKQVKVNLKSKISDLSDPKSIDLFMTDQNDDKQLDGYSVAPGRVYTSENAAIKDNGGSKLYAPTSGTFEKANATYYQALTVKSSNANLNALFDHLEDNSPSYTIVVNGKGYRGDEFADTFDANYNKNEFTVVRTIYTNNTPAVDVQDNLWETKDVTGVVTTKENPFYTLTNDKNEFVKDRALTGKSAWKTNAVRTNKSGVTQYRVATNEWIDAAGITYVDGATASANTALTSTQKYGTAHVVNFDTPGTVYRLFDINGKATDRYLAGGSSWLTNERMVDANGNVFYRVSANEFVKVDNGVSFK
ncbi:hypothetical protein [Lactobacillus terrae]|uniref:hypothetical protein n=1 Tax=Lactobacillus terrae TaxID=2269374 RepID=UPI000C1B7352|nr:hypothetical protein [Lactobacillus terrae]